MMVRYEEMFITQLRKSVSEKLNEEIRLWVLRFTLFTFSYHIQKIIFHQDNGSGRSSIFRLYCHDPDNHHQKNHDRMDYFIVCFCT